MIRVFQFRFQHVDPGNIKIVAPFSESIQFFERGAVDTIFQDSGRRSADAENTDRFPRKSSVSRSPGRVASNIGTSTKLFRLPALLSGCQLSTNFQPLFKWAFSRAMKSPL